MADMNMQSTDTAVYTKTESRKNSKHRKSRKTPPSFASDAHGQHIRNAVTGSYYEERVGTIEEKKFFKVAGKSVFKMNSGGVILDEGYHMSSFYYDSPEQYEKHKNVVLPLALKDSWHLNASVDDPAVQNISSALNFDAQYDADAASDDEDDLDEMIERLKNTSE